MSLSSRVDVDNLIESHDHFIFDLDGVLWKGSSLIEGSRETIRYLRSKNKRISFVTNNSTKSRKLAIEKFKQLEIQTDIDEVYTASSSVARYLKCVDKEMLKKYDRCYGVYALVVGEKGLMDELDLAELSGGVVHIDSIINQYGIEMSKADGFCDSFTKACKKLTDLGSTFTHVVVGYDPYFSYTKLCICSISIQDGADLVSTNLDPCDRVGSFTMPGNGSNVASIEIATGKKAIDTGKPSRYMYEALVDPCCSGKESNFISNSVMIGDRLDTDIAFGSKFNMTTVLVLSGVTQLQDLNVTESSNNNITVIKPDFIIPSIAYFLDSDNLNI